MVTGSKSYRKKKTVSHTQHFFVWPVKKNTPYFTLKCPLIDLLYCTLIVCLDSLDIRDCRTRGFQGPSWILSMLECSFGIFYTTSERAHGPHEEIKKKVSRFFSSSYLVWLPNALLCIVHYSRRSRGNLVSGLGFPVGRKEHFSLQVTFI